MREKKSPALDLVLQRLALYRMFLPLVALSVIAIGSVGFLGKQTLESRQHQMALSMARLVDRYLDQASRTLDAVARIAEVTPSENLDFIHGVWEAYGYFDTLYYLDASNRIRLLAPPNQRYMGMEMSNLPYVKQPGEKKNIAISRPFISLRTGNPTVYLIRQLSRGGQMVGELNLGSLQDEITRGKDASVQGTVFILDQFGMLLAHPSSRLVKQQTNLGSLEIFRRGRGGDAALIYRYAGRMVLGNATRVERSGWVVVNQIPLWTAFSYYAVALGVTLLALSVIWLALTWNLRRQLQRQVVTPLVQLSQGIGALTKGDFSRGKALAAIPASFVELKVLARKLQDMSDALEARQAALQESEERYRSLFERVPVALYRTTPAGEFLDGNQANIRLLGFKDRDSMLKVNAADLYLNPDDRRQWRAIAERDGIVKDLDMQLQRRDGTVVWLRNTGRAVRGSDGEVLYYEGHMEDVTERKRAERRLIESEQKFRSLAESSPDNIMRYDPEGRLIYINRNIELTVGEDLRALIGKKPEEHLVPEPIKGYRTKLKKVIKTGNPDEIELVVPNPKGELRTHHIRFVAERNNEGKIIGALAIGRDITERKQAEESIRKLSQAIEQSPVSILITDLGGKIEFVNAKFTQVTGYAAAEAKGKNPRILKSGETPADEYRRLWETIGAGKVWRGEFHNRKKNGELFWEQATIAPVRNADEAITHYVAVKEDITERKTLQEQFRQTQRMEAVGQLAGGVAHDFNNMLSVIIGHAELALGHGDLEDALRKNLQEILAAGNRSSDITRQLLAFARKQTIVPRVLDLNEAVEAILKLLRRLIGEDIDLAWIPGVKLWPVKMDPSQIDQILANLCVNARDAITGVGKITIETQCAVLDDAYCAEHRGFSPGEYTMLAVSDSGSGMDKSTMDKIFEPFFTTKGVGKGTGLGLATVYGITKQNKGFINVYSEPGIGTTFKIYMPRHAALSDQVPEDIQEPQSLNGHETILVVEDESLNLELAELMLKRFGYQVLAASSPGKALLAAKNHPGQIDLLLTDMIMPEMNGRELSNEINSLYPNIKCLYMSGYTNNLIVHQGILDKGIHFLQKPFSMQDLAIKVREALDYI